MGHYDLNGALVLVRVVHSGSFRAAARALSMPKSTVSRKIAELEAQLGAQLLQRTTRTLALTDAGAAFVAEAEAALARFDAAAEAVTELQREPRGRLRVTSTHPIGEALLGPIIAEFLDAYPLVEVHLHLTERPVDLVADRFDIAIRIGALPDSGLVAKRIGLSSYCVVASPDYVTRCGAPQRPSDLSQHHGLRYSKEGTPARTTWPLGRGKAAIDVPISGRFISDSFVTLRMAAERGLGIAHLPNIVVRDALRAGRLVHLLPSMSPPPSPVHLVHLASSYLPPRTRAFLDFVEPRLSAAFRG